MGLSPSPRRFPDRPSPASAPAERSRPFSLSSPLGPSAVAWRAAGYNLDFSGFNYDGCNDLIRVSPAGLPAPARLCPHPPTPSPRRPASRSTPGSICCWPWPGRALRRPAGPSAGAGAVAAGRPAGCRAATHEHADRGLDVVRWAGDSHDLRAANPDWAMRLAPLDPAACPGPAARSRHDQREEARGQLERIEAAPFYWGPPATILAYVLSAGSFAVFFGAGTAELGAALAVGLAVGCAAVALKRVRASSRLFELVAAAGAGLIVGSVDLPLGALRRLGAAGRRIDHPFAGHHADRRHRRAGPGAPGGRQRGWRAWAWFFWR